MNGFFMNKLLLSAWALTFLNGCTGCDTIDTPPEPPAAGSIDVVVAGDVATLNLSGVAGSLRSLQVDVVVAGGQARSIDGLNHDLVEAGLAAEQGGPKSRFTVVVADTRRLPVNNGVLARLTVDDGATVTLSNAVAIDEDGTKRTLTTDAN